MMLIYAIPILCAAITDGRKRIIPDWTWMTILVTGIFCAVMGETIGREVQGLLYIPLLDRIAGLVFRQSSCWLSPSSGAVPAEGISS